MRNLCFTLYQLQRRYTVKKYGNVPSLQYSLSIKQSLFVSKNQELSLGKFLKSFLILTHFQPKVSYSRVSYITRKKRCFLKTAAAKKFEDH